MKRLKYLLLVCCTLLSCLCLSEKTKADSIVVKAPDEFSGMMVDFHLSDGSVHSSKVGHIYANDMLTYCVEPLKSISTGNVMVPSNKLDATMRETLSVISYNGYNSANRNSDKWYAATQIYMWEALKMNPVVRGFDDYGSYRSQIETNINNFYQRPSFDNQQVTLEKGIEKTLLDTNNVLSSFKQLTHKGEAGLNRLSDRLILKSDSNAYSQGQITYRKLEDSQLGLPIVYQGAYDDTPQTIIYPHVSRNIEGNITYRIQPYGYLKFTKRGEVLTSSDKKESEFGDVYQLQFQEDYLKDVKVRIYAREEVKDVWGKKLYEKNQLVEEITSLNNAVQGKKLQAGKYYLKEFETVNGYVLDNKEYDFEISNVNKEIDIKDILLKNDRSKIEVEFQKQFEEGSLLDLSDAYKDIKMGIYTKKDIYTYQKELSVPAHSLVYVSKIDAQGKLVETLDLPEGEYYLKELSTNEHFVLDEKEYDFQVTFQHEPKVKISLGDNGRLVNKLHRNQLQIYKVSENEKKPLKATFVLYNQNMDEIEEFTTDKNGLYVFENLVDGVYFIQEIEAPDGYVINGKIQKITLNQDLKYTVKNKKKRVVNASIETNDQSNHRPWELSMLGGMVALYGLVIRRLRM